MADINARVRSIIGTTAEWTANNIVLGNGEIALERTATGAIKMKVGDGVKTFGALSYFADASSVSTSDLVKTSSGAASSGKIPQLNAAGKLDNSFIAFPQTLNFKGAVDPTVAAPSAPALGDLYVVNKAGNIDASYGVTGNPPVSVGDLIIRSTTSAWDVIANSVDVSSKVSKAGDTMTGNLVVPSVNNLKLSRGFGDDANTVAVGVGAGAAATGTDNVFIGANAGGKSTGNENTFIGANAGAAMTTGSKNTIVGSFSGNSSGVNISADGNYVVLSDGDGNIRGMYDPSTGRFYLGGTPKRTYVANGSVCDAAGPGNDNGIAFGAGVIGPCDGSSVLTDGVLNLGSSGNRWNNVYAANGTINTSDANAKQDDRALDAAERRAALRIKGALKLFRLKDSVACKGDAARIHTGAIAQEVSAAFVAEGLDPTRYALFCSDTWYEVKGQPRDSDGKPFTKESVGAVEITRLGLRYEELLCFVVSAI